METANSDGTIAHSFCVWAAEITAELGWNYRGGTVVELLTNRYMFGPIQLYFVPNVNHFGKNPFAMCYVMKASSLLAGFLRPSLTQQCYTLHWSGRRERTQVRNISQVLPKETLLTSLEQPCVTLFSPRLLGKNVARFEVW